VSGIVLAVIVFELLDLRSDEERLTAFISAARAGNVEEVRELIEAGVEPGTRTPEGWTALHYAALHGRVEVVALLLERGEPAHARHPRGATPLHRAAEHGSVEIARLLIARGAPIDAKAGGRTALAVAVAKRHNALAGYLVDQGADLGLLEPRSQLTPMLYAVLSDDPVLLAKVLARGAPVDDRLRNGESALHIAAVVGGPETLSQLLESGADPNAPNDTGSTPLHLAARRGEEPLVAMLVAAGADPEITNQEGQRAHQLLPPDAPAAIAEALGVHRE
jgi:ankyrin repeat protein